MGINGTEKKLITQFQIVLPKQVVMILNIFGVWVKQTHNWHK